MERLLLLARRQRNADLVRDWLDGAYDVEVVPEIPARDGFDLVLGDGEALIAGMDAVRELREEHAPVHLPVLFMTSKESVGLRTRGLWEVVDDVVFKPVQKVEFQARIEVLLRTRRLSLQLDRRQREIRAQLDAVQEDLHGALSDIDRVHRSAIEALAGALDLRHVETMDHCRRVSDLSLRLGREIGLDADELHTLERGALLHDIGKIGIPDGILLKPASLTEEEWSVMKTHPERGCELLAGIPFLAGAAEIVRHHHEHWDGGGYPDGLGGKEIPIGARVFSVADAHDAMTSDRPYRKSLPVEVARREIEENAGSQFDPDVVRAYLSLKGAPGE